MRRSCSKDKQYNKTIKESAKAPYNFVSLNDKIVPSDLKEGIIPDFNEFKKDVKDGLYSGYIELEIETLAPLCIDSKEKGLFFGINIGGTPIIPGSSLRGLTRTMIEIMGFGKMKFVEDRRLFYRSFGEKFLRREYQAAIQNAKPCLIRYRNKRYEYTTDVKVDRIDDGSKEFKIEKIDVSNWRVYSGRIQKKTKNWKFTISKDPEELTWVEIPKEDILLYEADKGRNLKEGFDILNFVRDEEEYPEGVPCFCLCMNFNGKDHLILGHTRYFRTPYKYTIKDHIPDEHKASIPIDIAEAIFGIESKFASRVYFEDAVVKGDCQFYKQTSPKILSSPKPTCFQHYLEQDNPDRLKTWNDKETKIRGYKLYWHRKTSSDASDPYSWNEGKIIRDTQHTIINPLKEGTKFEGIIRFVNLSTIELGAILYSLDLPDGCCHKIGMAKPLGLGSVRIKPKLYLIDRKSRYEKLFADDKWHIALKKGELGRFKKDFEEYIIKSLDINNDKFESIERIKELFTLLKWDEKIMGSKDWLEKTRYMQIECKPNEYNCINKEEAIQGKVNEYKKRPILRKPTEIIV